MQTNNLTFKLKLNKKFKNLKFLLYSYFWYLPHTKVLTMLSYCMLTETNTLIISLTQITMHSGIFKYKKLSSTIVWPVRHTKLWHTKKNYAQKLQFKRRILTNNFNNLKIVFIRLQFCCITSVISKLTVSGIRVDVKNCGDPSKKSGWSCFTKHLIDI